MRARRRDLLLVLCLWALYTRTAWSGLTWGLSGNVIPAAAMLRCLRPPLPPFPSLLGAVARICPLGDLALRTNLIWGMATAGVCLLVCWIASRPSRAMAWLLALTFGVLDSTWIRSCPLDLAGPPSAILLLALYAIAKGRTGAALLCLGGVVLCAPGGLWVAAPLALWILLTRSRRTGEAVRHGTLLLLGLSGILFVFLRDARPVTGAAPDPSGPG